MRFAHLNTPIRTLRVRLLIWITVAVFLMVGTTMLLIHANFQRVLYNEFDHVLKAESRDISSTLREFDNPQGKWQEAINRKAHKFTYFVEVFDESHKLIWSTESDTFPPEGVPVPVFPADPPEPFTDEAGAYILPKVPFAFSDTDAYRILIRKRKVEEDEKPKQAIWFRVGMSKAAMLAAVAKLDRIMIVAGLGIIVVTPLGAYVLAGRATRPLAKIIATTARLKPEKLNERLHLRGTGDELDQLSETINGMLDRIGSYIDRHRDFIADAAHELRSPLTAIRSSVEVALNRPRSTEEYQSLLSDVMEECSGLAILVNRLLFLAEGDAGRLACGDQSASLAKLVRESADMFQAVAESRGVDLEVEELEPCVVRGDELHLRQVIRNLIDNAVKFTRGPGRVSVAVHADHARKQARLTVSDTGCGIPPEDQARIFDRFYRADKSRNRHDAGGFGLGLSICHAVVKSLGGDISVASEVGRGATFSVVLPLVADAVAAAELATAAPS